jgi:hypothetical protein
VYRIDPSGQQVEVEAEWIPMDPDLVAVSPGKGDQVTISIKGLGETSLLVKAPGISKNLQIKTMAQNEHVQVVEISQ